MDEESIEEIIDRTKERWTNVSHVVGFLILFLAVVALIWQTPVAKGIVAYLSAAFILLGLSLLGLYYHRDELTDAEISIWVKRVGYFFNILGVGVLISVVGVVAGLAVFVGVAVAIVLLRNLDVFIDVIIRPSLQTISRYTIIDLSETAFFHSAAFAIGVFIASAAIAVFLYIIGVPLELLAIFAGIAAFGLTEGHRSLEEVSRDTIAVFPAMSLLIFPVWLLSTANAVLSVLAGDFLNLGFASMVITAALTSYFMLPDSLGGGDGLSGVWYALTGAFHAMQRMLGGTAEEGLPTPIRTLIMLLSIEGILLIGMAGSSVFGLGLASGTLTMIQFVAALIGPVGLYWLMRAEHFGLDKYREAARRWDRRQTEHESHRAAEGYEEQDGQRRRERRERGEEYE